MSAFVPPPQPSPGQVRGCKWRAPSSSPRLSGKAAEAERRGLRCKTPVDPNISHLHWQTGGIRGKEHEEALSLWSKRLLERNITDERGRGFQERRRVGTSKEISRSCKARWRGRCGGEITRSGRQGERGAAKMEEETHERAILKSRWEREQSWQRSASCCL